MRWFRALVLPVSALAVLLVPAAARAQAPDPEGLPPFGTEPQEVERTPDPVPRLTGIRSGQHAGFDRVVLDFDGAVPGYSLRYVPALEQEGSGRVVEVRGDATLELLVTPADAHDEAGGSTVPGRRVTSDFPALREVRLVSDFEARVLVGIGVAEETGFRAVELADPSRLVVDVAHPDAGGGPEDTPAPDSTLAPDPTPAPGTGGSGGGASGGTVPDRGAEITSGTVAVLLAGVAAGALGVGLLLLARSNRREDPTVDPWN